MDQIFVMNSGYCTVAHKGHAANKKETLQTKEKRCKQKRNAANKKETLQTKKKRCQQKGNRCKYKKRNAANKKEERCK